MADKSPLDAAQIQEMLDRNPFISFLGCKVERVDAEAQEIVMTMGMRPEFERRPGSGQYHGGVIASFIDTVGDYALVINLGGGVPTINFRTDYLRPAMNGTRLHGVARVRRAGRTVAVVDIDVMDDDGRLVAVGRGTYGTTVG